MINDEEKEKEKEKRRISRKRKKKCVRKQNEKSLRFRPISHEISLRNIMLSYVKNGEDTSYYLFSIPN